MSHVETSTYRGRLAPTPSGHLHLGHGRTFHLCARRACEAGGALVLRIEDLDPQRCKPEFIDAVYEDFAWMGLAWDEGPFLQSARRARYLDAWRKLKDAGCIYPCTRSRKDLRNAALAPHEEDEGAEPLYPPEWRPEIGTGRDCEEPAGANWRFRVPDGRRISFEDTRLGPRAYEAGTDFGDFVVWRRDDVPAYELAVVVDDAEMAITEVVRGEDLLRSTARQLLVYEALGKTPPAFHHAGLVRDDQGRRLAKRHDALSMKALRESGRTFADCLAELER